MKKKLAMLLAATMLVTLFTGCGAGGKEDKGELNLYTWDGMFPQEILDGFEKETAMIKMMGFDGKSLVNPRQIAVVHKIFTPTEKEIIFAEKVVREIDDKKAKGIGVFTVDGKMIDIAFYDGAKRTLAMAKAAGVYEGDM